MENRESKQKEKTKMVFGESAMSCPNCHGDISPSDINLNETLAKCGHCDHVFTLEDDPFFFNQRRGRPEVVMPDGTEVLKLGDTLEIRVDWWNSKSKASMGFLGMFAFLWNIIVLPMAVVMVFAGGLLALLPLSLHLLVGLGFIMAIVAQYFNYTDIIIDEQKVSITTKPIKFFYPKDKEYRITDIRQVFVKKYRTGKTKNGRVIYEMGLFMKMYNDKEYKLAGGLTKETLLYMEQELERFLKIPDKKIEGEII